MCVCVEQGFIQTGAKTLDSLVQPGATQSLFPSHDTWPLGVFVYCRHNVCWFLKLKLSTSVRSPTPRTTFGTAFGTPLHAGQWTLRQPTRFCHFETVTESANRHPAL